MRGLNSLCSKSDIYSLGITLLLSLFNNGGVFYIQDRATLTAYLEDTFDYCPKPNESVDEWVSELFEPYYKEYRILMDLLYNMLMAPRKYRYDINQVINHHWFNPNVSTA